MCYESGWFWRQRTTKQVRDEEPKVDVTKRPAQPSEPPKAAATTETAREREKLPA